MVHNAGPAIVYHYTDAAGAVAIAKNGLWPGSAVTADLYATPQAASQALGIPVGHATHVVAIENAGQFRPLQGGVVQPSIRYSGGGSQFTNDAKVPASTVRGTFTTGSPPPPGC